MRRAIDRKLRRLPTEHELQAEFINHWLPKAAPKIFAHAFKNESGGGGKAFNGMAKARGVVTGTPDLILHWTPFTSRAPAARLGRMWMEWKRSEKEDLTDAQIREHERLRSMGEVVVTVWSIRQALLQMEIHKAPLTRVYRDGNLVLPEKVA